MIEMGLFGTTIPEEYGGLGLGLDTYTMIVMELSRGWTTLPGILNGSFIAAYMIRMHGTEEQRERLLPKLAACEIRAAFSMTEPHAGSDVQSMRTTAVRDGDDYVISGQKMWVTNGWRSGLIMLLAKTDPTAEPPHKGMTGFIVEKEPETSPPGLTIPMPGLKKLGYKGVESTELVFDGFRTPASSVLGGEAGDRPGVPVLHERHRGGPRQRRRARRRPRQGRARRRAALRDRARGVRQEDRRTTRPCSSCSPRWPPAPRRRGCSSSRPPRGRPRASAPTSRPGMAKYFATEAAQDNALDCMRIHGGYGYSLEYRPERYYRDAPLLLIGEGSNEIQQLIIARRLLERQGA